MVRNPLRKTVYIWAGITIVAVAMIFTPGFLGVDGMSGGYAISFVSFFGVIVGIIVMVIYSRLASRCDRILSGEDLLAHWIYTPELWRKYSEKEYGLDRSEKKALFYLVSGISLFISFLFLMIDPEVGAYVFASMSVLIVIIGLTAILSSMHGYRRNMKNLGEAYIGRDGVYLNRQFHT